ncbi:DUF4180 domain-containing protein [Herpetosiphon sp. NSE202]|uniref:DUF4180 domain-containing protein n=1 Tax=Herpetosiphon sp. NSE202 TaxID=3351349 RepID=UPI0036384D55
MELLLVETPTLRYLIGPQQQPVLQELSEINQLLEYCFGENCENLVLYPENLTPGFFDLSSREAGEIQTKLRQYSIHAAIIVDLTSHAHSQYFAEMAYEENKRGFCYFCATVAEAEAWFARH